MSNIYVAYACDPQLTKGRLYHEDPTPYRNEYERDRDRIIHSNAFRRLQYKTQVFVNHEGDHYRNRLTHSIEVSAVARSIAKTLGLSDDLAESVALAHDIGHTPFGHAGEDALNESMQNYGGFSHNDHSLKLLTKLEERYAGYNGLNLTWEVIEGIIKHNGPITSKVSEYLAEYNATNDLKLHEYSSAEAQIASLSDDIAYICHDLEDSVRENIISFHDLRQIPLLDNAINKVQSQYTQISQSRLIYEVVRMLTHILIKDLLSQTQINITKQPLQSHNAVRQLNYQLVDFSSSMKIEIATIKSMLFAKVYRSPQVTKITIQCQQILKDLFYKYMQDLSLLPGSWIHLAKINDEKSKASLVADYIAGMTDRFAIKEHGLLL